MSEQSPKERLYWLMELLVGKEIETSNFCDEFYQTYEHDLNEKLSDTEKSLFMEISQKGSRFSEFHEDHLHYPGVYVTDLEIRSLVLDAWTKLKGR